MIGGPGETDEFVALMRETRGRYIAGFPAQLDHFRTLVDAGTGDAPAALRSAVHRMAGLAGTLGFHAVSTEAGRFEMLLARAVDGTPLEPSAAGAAIEAIGDAFTSDLSNPPVWETPASVAEAAHVLIAEDDEDQLRIVRGGLERAGFTTTGVNAGDQVLQAAKRERPSVILLDVHLPGMDGYSVCRQLKADEHTHAIPVVFVTTRAAMSERLAGLTLGADDYLTKPVDMGELLLRIRRLQRRPASSAVPDVSADTPLTYERWLDAARTAGASGPVAVALVRAPQDRQSDVAIALRENLRRRDVIGAYDRTHLLALLPGQAAAQAASDLHRVLSALPGSGLAAGVTSGSGANIERLIADADEALASARHSGELTATFADRSRIAAAAPSRTILLAEDDPDVMHIVDAQMKGLGFHTRLAFDGEAATEALGTRPDVVVLDLMMPRMTGFEVLRHIGRLDAPRPKVIVLSARGREDDVTRAFDLGADDYMVKPFSPQELGARVARLLR